MGALTPSKALSRSNFISTFERLDRFSRLRFRVFVHCPTQFTAVLIHKLNRSLAIVRLVWFGVYSLSLTTHPPPRPPWATVPVPQDIHSADRI